MYSHAQVNRLFIQAFIYMNVLNISCSASCRYNIVVGSVWHNELILRGNNKNKISLIWAYFYIYLAVCIWFHVPISYFFMAFLWKCEKMVSFVRFRLSFESTHVWSVVKGKAFSGISFKRRDIWLFDFEITFRYLKKRSGSLGHFRTTFCCSSSFAR